MLDLLLAYLREAAPDQVDIPILQPADPFLETAGEDMRRRIFLTETTDGVQHCLRPEFTIPICLAHRGGVARYAYGGTVFRQNRQGSSEFQQAGLEDLGNSDSAGADAAAMADMLDALERIGVAGPGVVIGDQNLFGVVVENLQLPEPIAARLVRNFGEPEQIGRIIDSLTADPQSSARRDEVYQLALAGDEAALEARVLEMMQIAGLPPHAGRSPGAIALRMIARVRESSFRLDAERAEILRNFLALETPLDGAAAELARFAASAGLDFGSSLALFEERVAGLRARNVALGQLTYRASFGRRLDYYTGVLFEAEMAGVAVAGGGRYDHLCTLLGSDEPVPAVGFSISLDRVAEVLA